MKLNPKWCMHEYKWSVLIDLMFTENSGRKKKTVPFRPMRLFCSSSFTQMKKLARRHQQQQEQQNSQRLGQGRGSVMEAKQGGKNLQAFSKCHSHMDTNCLSTAMQGIHKCVPLPVEAQRAAVSEWLWYVIPNSSQTLSMLTEASTFLEEICSAEELTLEEISRRLT